MKTPMANDNVMRAIARDAISAVERVGHAAGQRLLEDQRMAAEVRAQLFTDWQASTQAAGRQLLEENEQALADVRVQTLARVRQVAADIAREN